MIYVFCALDAEAAPLVRALSLRKKRLVHGVDSFESADERLRLSVCGFGIYAAIAAVSSVLAVLPPGPADQLLFFGSAAAVTDGTNGLYRIRSILDQPSGKRYYPDLIWNLALPEADAVTGLLPMTERGRNGVLAHFREPFPGSGAPLLYDMESSGVYLAASRHMGPHQITILRYVSDQGVSFGLRREIFKAVRAGAEEHAPAALRVIETLRKIGEATGERRDLAGELPEEEELASDLHCSVAMRSSLRQLIRYADLAGLPWRAWTAELMEKPCPDRRAGKERFDELRQLILHA